MKVFVAGPRTIKKLDENICDKIKNICLKKYEILIGDAEGIDSTVQKFLNSNLYRNVKIYASQGIARNNYGDWKIENVHVDDNVKGFDFYAKKDLEMAKAADIGFMIWNGKSKGTFNNIINLITHKKEVILYYVVNKKFYHLKQMKDLDIFLNANVKLNNNLKKLLPKKNIVQFTQVALF